MFASQIDYTFFNEYIKRFVEANSDRYNYIKEEAISYVVNCALGTNKVLHIFGDTTLEFPYTLEYKKRFNKNAESQGVRILTAKNREKNFEDLCAEVGPPSRVMRWCCTIFKTGAIQRKPYLLLSRIKTIF